MMMKLCLLVFSLIFVQNVWAQSARQPLSEAERKLSDELKSDPHFKTIGCGQQQSAEMAAQDASNKLKAAQVYRGEGEKIKLKKTCETIEGDRVFSYLTVENDKASIMVDASQDEFGPPRVYSHKCEEFDFGVYFNDLKTRRMVFQIGGETKVENGYAALRCMSEQKEIIF